MKKVILHIDMDAFFASVEQRDNPALAGRPIAVIGSNQRTVIVSPSYEARRFGVKTSMTRHQAMLLCPEIVFVTAQSDKYAYACSQILDILQAFTPDIEVYSIDEFFLDITATMHLFGSAKKIAEAIRLNIHDKLGLNASVGVSYNKLLAKFASDMAKPNGIFILDRDNIDDVFEHAKVEQLCGIGKKTCQRLNLMGIQTIGQLRQCSPGMLEKVFGVNGLLLHNMANGVDLMPVIPIGSSDHVKSIGHSMTFQQDTLQAKLLSRYLLELSGMVGARLRRSGLVSGCVRITLRYKSFKTFTVQRALPDRTDDTKKIYHTARSILSDIDLKEPVRLLGVTCSRLCQQSQPESLFEQDNRRYKLNQTMDMINERFECPAVCFASLLGQQEHKKVISPSWQPHGKRNY
jgi:DNA polymerase IV